VTFTTPLGTVPTNDSWTANLTGAVVSNNSGALTIDFNNTAHHFTFDNGTFDFFVNDVDLTPGGSIALSGRAQVTAVPEPETLCPLHGRSRCCELHARRRKT